MRKPLFAHFAALAAPALVFTAMLAPRPSGPVDAEIGRLRSHFATVEAELLARDVSTLTDAQRAARARHLMRLREYARGGVFPKNTDFPGRAVPYFIDRAGTRCAMAYLIEESGRGDYVRRVSDKVNNARIAEIARDAELAPILFAWLEENGLTVDEAARIQPMYCGEPWGVGCIPDDPIPTPRKMSTDAAMVSALLGAGMTLWNATGPQPKWLGVLGLASGAAGLTVGASHLSQDGGDRALGLLNVGIGAAAAYFGARWLGRGSSSVPAATAAVAPLVSSEGAAGLALRLSF